MTFLLSPQAGGTKDWGDVFVSVREGRGVWQGIELLSVEVFVPSSGEKFFVLKNYPTVGDLKTPYRY